MTLVDALVEEFRKVLTAIFKREEIEDDYMKHNWLGCRWRAFKAVYIAVKDSKIIEMLALSIAHHRAVYHGENKETTISKLEGKLTYDQVESVTGAETKGWNN